MTELQRADIYVPITSITKADGGRTRIVTGKAASDRLDYDGERASYDWFKKELTDWFKVGNMRQDHRPGGVGKALSLEFDDIARTATVTSKAVDPDTILKLDEQVLNGYSWGAKSVPGNPIRVRKDATGTPWVESGKIVEVSYVDHPANPDCFVSLVKSAGKRGLQRSKQLGDLDAGGMRVAGGQDLDVILRGLLADIAKRDVSAAERDRLGDQGHAIDTGQDHPSYPIANKADLGHAIQAYGRAKPADRAALRRHIISEARRLGATDMIPDDWKSLEAVLLKQSMAGCGCCDDCGPDCQGDCCDTCRQMAGKAAAPGPAGILEGVTALAAGETDEEFRGFLGKLASAVEGWFKTDGVSVEVATYATLATLATAASEPDLAKRRTFYSNSNRANVEQALQQLHQELGVFMEGAVSTDADKDQRNGALTGQDAPAADDQPGGPGTAPGDGNPGDGNLAFDPEMVRDGDPAIRTPDGERDGRAQGEAGTHTPPPAGDALGPGPGDQGKGDPPAGKGRDGGDQREGGAPPGKGGKAAKAEKRLKRLQAELDELRKAASAKPNGGPPIQLNQTLAPPAATPPPAQDRTKALRKEVAALGADLRKALEDRARAPEASGAPAAAQAVDARIAKALRRLEKRDRTAAGEALRAEVRSLGDEVRKALGEHVPAALASQGGPDQLERVIARVDKRLRRMQKRLASPAAAPEPPPNPLEAQIAELRAVIAGQASKGAAPDSQNSDATLLLMADLTRAAFDGSREDARQHAERLAKRMKRDRRTLRKAVRAAVGAQGDRLAKVASDVEALGRLPRPGGPQIARPSDKTFPVNDTVERSVGADVLKRMQILKEMSESSDRQTAADARTALRSLMAEVAG